MQGCLPARVLPTRVPLMGGPGTWCPRPLSPHALSCVCAQRGLSSSRGHPQLRGPSHPVACGTPDGHTPGGRLGAGARPRGPHCLCALSCRPGAARLPQAPSWSVPPWARKCVQGLDSICVPACTPSQRPPAGSEPQVWRSVSLGVWLWPGRCGARQGPRSCPDREGPAPCGLVPVTLVRAELPQHGCTNGGAARPSLQSGGGPATWWPCWAAPVSVCGQCFL